MSCHSTIPNTSGWPAPTLSEEPSVVSSYLFLLLSTSNKFLVGSVLLLLHTSDQPLTEPTPITNVIKESFLEKILETMRSLKETQERQGEKIEALMASQMSNTKSLSAEDALKNL